MGLATWRPEVPPTLRLGLSRRPARDLPVLPPRGTVAAPASALHRQLHSAAGGAKVLILREHFGVRRGGPPRWTRARAR